MNFDYETMTAKVSSAARQSFYREFSVSYFRRLWLQVIGVVVMFAVDLGFVVLVLPHMIDNQEVAKWLSVGSAAAIGIGGFFFVRYLQTAVNTRVRLWHFARSNGLEYRSEMPLANLKGAAFRRGDFQKARISDVLRDKYARLPWLVGRFQFTIGEGKKQQTYARHFVRLTLNRRMPHIALQSRGNALTNSGVLALLEINFKQNQRLKLEGNFNKYFDVYVPKEYERDALYIFTPDLMQKLLDVAKGCDIEIVDDTAYIYSRELHFEKPGALEELLGAIDYLSAKLDRQTERYRDEKAIKNETKRQPSKGTIAAGGQELTAAFDPWPIISGLLIVGFFVALGLLLYLK